VKTLRLSFRIVHRAFLSVFLLLGGQLSAATWETVNLHPPGSINSVLGATTGTRQGGTSSAHAGLWSGTAASFVDLHPSAGAASEFLLGMSATQQVGYFNDGTYLHACLWNGTAASFVDLNPAAVANYSYAYATDGTTQAGYAVITATSNSHACIWTGTAASFVDLNPAGIVASQIMAAGGGQQGGRIVASGYNHAAIWSGTAASYVDLAPTDTNASLVSATDGITQGGYRVVGSQHACIWHGTPASFVDLHPGAPATASSVNAVSGAYQAGYTLVAGQFHAALWQGTVASFVDLHALLPTGYLNSTANGIWTDGRFIQVVGSAYNIAAMHDDAMIWKTDLFPPQHRPVVTVKGKKHITTTAAKLLLRGTARDEDGDLAKVQIKVGKHAYRTAKGTPSRWKFLVRLQPGQNKALVRAVDEAGTFSKTIKLVIVRS
jgi:hypothetical protein